MESEPWQIAAAKFCVGKKEFTLKELRVFLEGKPYEIPYEHVRSFFIENIQHPAGRQFNREFRPGIEGGYWTAPAELVSMITDYEELKEARKNAYTAFWISMLALAISTLGAYFQYLSIGR